VDTNSNPSGSEAAESEGFGVGPTKSASTALSALVAELLPAGVAVAILVANLRSDNNVLLPVKPRYCYSDAGTLIDQVVLAHGWPFRCASRQSDRLFGEGPPPSLDDFPRPFDLEHIGHVNWMYLLVDLGVALAIVCCTIYVTRRWFKVPARCLQFNLFTLLWLPAVPLVAYLLVLGHTPTTGYLVSAFA